MHKSKISTIASLILLFQSALFSAPFFCQSTSATYANQSQCNTACGTTCQTMTAQTSGTSGTCDTTNYKNFVGYGGKTYAISNASVFWTDKSNLAIPSDQSLNTVLQSVGSGWIGVYDPLNSTDYNTVDTARFKASDGSTLLYTNWVSGQPDNMLANTDIGVTPINGEQWAYMQGDGTWADDGYHASYGGSYKPMRPAIVEWSGPFDCVNGTPPATTSNSSGYWCSSGSGSPAQCTSSTQYSGMTTTTQYAAMSTGGQQATLTITSSGTFSVPSGVTSVNICMCGGGGGGAHSYNSYLHEGGGYAGSIVSQDVTVTPGQQIAVTIGTGGINGAHPNGNGGAGTASSFGSIVANGGPGGSLNSASYGGNGSSRTSCGGTFYDGGIGTYGSWTGYGGQAGAFGNGSRGAGNMDVSSSAGGIGAGGGGATGWSLAGVGGRGQVIISYGAQVCPSGYTPTGQSGANACSQTTSSCPSGYTPTGQLGTNACSQTVGPTCPLGNYTCTDISGSVQNTDTTQGATDKTNNGTKDSSGNCLGQIYIFNGNDDRCRPPGMQTGYSDCCQKGTGWFGLTQCTQQEKTLGSLRSFGQQDGQCHYIGSYCTEKWPLIGCVQDKKTYCCFSSSLARVIQEGGRPQLGISWGTPESPQCRGFTPEEFQKIDFSKVDFSDWINNSIKPGVQSTATGNLTNVAKNIGTSIQQ